MRGYTSQLECRWSHLQKDGRLMTASHDGWHWNTPSSPMMGLPTQPAGPWSVVVPGVIDPEELSPESRLNPPTNTTTGNSGSCGKEAAAATISSLVPAWPVARGPSRSMCTHRGPGTVVSHSVRATPRRPLISLHASRLRSNSRWQRTFHEGQSGAFGRCDFSSTSPTQDPAASTIGIIRCACRRCMIRCSPHFQRGWCAVQDAPSDRASRVS